MTYLDMKEQFVYDPLISKRQQYLLATQVSIAYTAAIWDCVLMSVVQLVRAVLKIGK